MDSDIYIMRGAKAWRYSFIGWIENQERNKKMEILNKATEFLESVIMCLAAVMFFVDILMGMFLFVVPILQNSKAYKDIIVGVYLIGVVLIIAANLL